MVDSFNCPKIWLKQGDKGSNVTLLQQSLKKVGYYTTVNGHYLKIDGYYGYYTKQAVIAFQKKTNNRVDGIFGKETCNSLSNMLKTVDGTDNLFDCSNTTISEGSSDKDSVILVQKMLSELNYYQGRIDGIFGYYTKDSLQEFQRLIGENANGVFSGKTCSTLCDHYKNKKTKESIQKASNTTTNKIVVQQVNPDKPDLSKNIWTISEAHVSIDGINIKATNIEPNTAFNTGNWKQIELMNGHFHTYKAHNQPKQYTIESHMHLDNLKHLKNEFIKMQNRICRVVSNHMDSGNYVISIKYTKSKGYFYKVTFTLTEAY